ncbi:hypothetical protein Leryth_021300 [Lithospermum erythrorhizon]|nr:hypothetical protein Leryth_021300 [Lithospermum erythrorhizon]
MQIKNWLVTRLELAGCISPSLCFPSVVGFPRHTGVMVDMAPREYYVGEKAQRKRGVLAVKSYRTNKMGFYGETIAIHSLDELAIKSEEHPILFTHSPFLSGQYQEKLTTYVRVILCPGHWEVDRAEIVVIENLKEKLGYIALDFERELKLAKECPSSFEESYELPSGQLLVVHHSTRFSSLEPIFQPSLIGLEDGGIHRSANDSIMMCDEDIRGTLYKNVVLSDASTMFPGFPERITKEIASLSAPNNFKVE